MVGGKIVKLRNIKRALSLGVPKEDNVSFVLGGRISAFRPYKSFNFIDLIDGSTKDHLQVVVKRDLLEKPELGAYAVFQGSLVASKGQQQSAEFKVKEVRFLSKCDPAEYPMATTVDQSNNWYRRIAHLRPRAPHFMSLLRVRSEVELSIHMIMKQMDFFRIQAPILTSNDSEASSDLFLVKRSQLPSKSSSRADLESKQERAEHEVFVEEGNDAGEDSDSDGEELEKINSNLQSPSTKADQRIVKEYFNKDVFLITSAQLHLENLAAALSRVYSLSSCFRAENSISSRHLCEFQMFELEEANITELDALMNRAETIIKFIAQYLVDISDHSADFSFLLERNKNAHIVSKLIDSNFIRMSYEDAMEILESKTDFSGDTSYGADIGRLHEKKLLEHTNNVPIFVTHYPRTLKPFYMKLDDLNEKALCFDLIAPHGGEICGGSLREDCGHKLEENLRQLQQQHHSSGEDKEDGSSMANFNWYLDLRRFGSFPHGGFGLGFDRLLQTLLGIKNIKDTTAFPRSTGYCPM